MKQTWLKIGSAIAVMAITASVQAVPISGTMTFSGNVFLNGPNAGPASTTALAWSSTVIGASSLSPVAASGSIAFTPNWIYSGSPVVASLFTVSGYNFQVLSDTVTQTPTLAGYSLDIQAFGVLSGNGATPTSYIMEISTQDPNANGSWSISGSLFTPVPDGGTTAMLLGMALSGVALLRKKLMA